MPRQTSFAAGELSPLMWGRTDSSLYGAGVRKLRNFFVSQQGAAVSRPGSRTVAVSDLGQFSAKRLIPFVESDSSTFLLELLPSQLRVWGHTSAGGFGSWDGTWERKATFAAPWISGTQATVRGAQWNSAMILTGFNFPPYVLRHLADGTWTLTKHRIGAPRNFDDSDQVHACFLLPATRGDTRGGLPMIAVKPPEADGTYIRFVGDASHAVIQGDFLFTSLLLNTVTKERAESLPSMMRRFSHPDGSGTVTLPLIDDKLVRTPDWPPNIRWDPDVLNGTQLLDSDKPTSDWKVVGHAIYFGRGKWPGGSYGLVGVTKQWAEPPEIEGMPEAKKSFIDQGDLPDLVRPPPEGRDPFGTTDITDTFLSDSIFTSVRTPGGNGYPAAVGFFEGRLVFAGCTNHPQRIFTSATGDYSDFDQPDLVSVPDDTALEFELASSSSEAIRHLVPLRKLLVMTDTSVWQFGGANGPLAPDSVSALRVDTLGSSAFVPPLSIGGDRLLVLRPSGRQVALITPDGDGSYQSRDVSTHAQHLLSAGITSWCFAQMPWGCVWATTADGRLLSLTLGESAAWAQHDSQTGEGETPAVFQSVASVPEARSGDGIIEDAVYVLVKRQKLGSSWPTSGSMTLERLAPRDALVTSGQCSVDSAVPVSLVVGDGTPDATQSVTGLPAHFIGKKVWLVTKRNAPVDLDVSTAGTVAVPASALTDGDDGSKTPGVSVITGWLGFRFTCQMELLDVGAGDARMSQKTTVAVGVEVDSAIGLQVGQDFGHLSTWKQRTPSDSYASPSAATTLVQMPVTRTWDKSARAVVQQETPRPLTVLGITREVDTGAR